MLNNKKSTESKQRASTANRSAQGQPRITQIGDLRDVQAKGGSYGDHDTGYYYSRLFFKTDK